MRGVPGAVIAQETGLDRKRVLRALTVIRKALARRAAPAPRGATRSSASGEAPVLGLFAARGRAFATVLPDADAQAVRRAVRKRRLPLRLDPDRFPYGAVVYRGHFYRLATSIASGGRRAGFGELEAFWGYLRQQLRSRGGIRRERLGLYLVEYTWRYNSRKLPAAIQLQDLVDLVSAAGNRWSERDFAARG